MSLEYSSLHALRSIVASTINESGVVVIDATPTIYRYSSQGQYIKHANMKGVESYPNRYGSSVTITNDGKFGLVCDRANERVIFLSLEPVKLLSMIPMSKPDVVLFSDNNLFFAIGSNSGRLDIYKTLTYERLCEVHLSDSIVCAAFSKDGSKIAISTMDKKIHLLRIDTHKVIQVFRIDEIAEAVTFAADNNKIIGFTRAGTTYVYNLLLNQQFLGDPSLEWPTHIASGFNENVILLGSRSNQLMIYNNSDGVKLGCVNFDFWGITSISVSGEKIFVGFSDGNGVVIDLHSTLQEAYSAIETGNIANLSLLAGEFPLIFVNKDICAKLEKQYESIFKFNPSNSDERKGHEAMVSLIVADGAIRKELMHSLYTSEEIVPFMEKISLGNAQGACVSVRNSPQLRQLREFHEVRTGCLKALMYEIKLLEIDPEKFNEYIESAPGGCTKCVHSLIPRPEVLEENYKKLLSSASTRNFAALSDIGEKHEMLRQTKVYRRFMSYGETLIDKTLALMAEGKMDQADEYASKLTRIKPFSLTGNDFKNQIKAFDAFNNASKTNNLIQLFTLACEYPALRTTQIFKNQVDAYKKNIISTANILAKKGDVSKVIALIAPYSTIDYFEEKNLSLLKKALIHEIEFYAPSGEESTLMERYHSCFGWDKEYARVCLSLKVSPNHMKKMEDVAPECKNVSSLLTGEKILRTLQNKEMS